MAGIICNSLQHNNSTRIISTLTLFEDIKIHSYSILRKSTCAASSQQSRSALCGVRVDRSLSTLFVRLLLAATCTSLFGSQPSRLHKLVTARHCGLVINKALQLPYPLAQSIYRRSPLLIPRHSSSSRTILSCQKRSPLRSWSIPLLGRHWLHPIPHRLLPSY